MCFSARWINERGDQTVSIPSFFPSAYHFPQVHSVYSLRRPLSNGARVISTTARSGM